VVSSNWNIVGSQEFNNPSWSAGEWAWGTEDQFAQVDRVEPIDIFVRVNGEQHLFFVHAGGQWQLHEDRVDHIVGIEFGNELKELCLGSRCWQVIVKGLNANRSAIGMFHANVFGRWSVITNEHGGKADRSPNGSQARDSISKLHLHACGESLTVEQDSHSCLLEFSWI